MPPPRATKPTSAARAAKAFAAAIVGAGLIQTLPTYAADPPALPAWSEQQLAAWWKANPDPAAWRTGAGNLRAALAAATEKHGAKNVLANSHFQNWLVLARWLSLFPASDDGYFATAEGRRTFAEIGSRHDLPRLFVQSLNPKDDPPKAAEILCQIYQKQPRECIRYPALAVAFSVVYDQPFPAVWPHPFVEFSRLDTGDSDPAGRFAFYVESHRADALLIDPSRLSVRELVFLVDSPLTFTELRYAHQVKLRVPGRLAELYQAIQYDNGRMNSGAYRWPHPTYRLIDIGKRGGICADQAFFVSQTGKSQGVPTVFFLGQGRSGGHAWVGFLKGRDDWVLDVAKYSGQDYPVGVAYDPQTWRRITDTQFAFIMKGTTGISQNKSNLALQWAGMNPGANFERDVLQVARETMPRSFDAWELEAEWIDQHAAGDAEKIAFWRSWAGAFRDESDMQMRAHQRLLTLFESAGDQFSADKLKREILRENASERFDLGIRLAASIILEKAEKGDWEGAEKEFRLSMSRFRKKAGGHLFYNLLEPYAEACLDSGKRDQAERALTHIENGGFKIIPKSLLDNHVKDLRRRVGK